MRIACLQFAPQVGDIDNNMNLADAILSRASPKDLDLLVLPELAFSGYNFRSLQHITPFLEPAENGITSLWAKTTALEYDCVVTVGYPEQVDLGPSPEFYNSSITINSDGEIIANYRKSFLFFPDEYCALQGPDEYFGGTIETLGNVVMGSCRWPTSSFEQMEQFPYKYEALWKSTWEFTSCILHRQANLVVLTMSWFSLEDRESYRRQTKNPDMETISYWLERLEPLIRADTVGEIIIVLANRTGTEAELSYAGTSVVLGIKNGEVKVYGILGRGEEALLVVDTEKPAAAMVMPGPNLSASNVCTTSFSYAAIELKESSTMSTDATNTVQSPITLDSRLSVGATRDLVDPQSFGLELELSLNLEDDQITRLSPVPGSPDACFAPTTGRFPWSSDLYESRPDSPTCCDFNQSTRVELMATCKPRRLSAVAESEDCRPSTGTNQTMPLQDLLSPGRGDIPNSASPTRDKKGILNGNFQQATKYSPLGIMTGYDIEEHQKAHIYIDGSPIFGSFERTERPKSQTPGTLSGFEPHI